jgi:preprotein translocase subunit YajC
VIISSAYAQAAPAASGGDPGFIGFLPIILMFVLLYFLMIRPQMKRAKETKTMIEALQKGDEVLTAGGIVGKIVEMHDQYVTVQVAAVNGQPVQLSMQRAAVQTLLPKDTFKPA